MNEKNIYEKTFELLSEVLNSEKCATIENLKKAEKALKEMKKKEI